jgi:Rieske 2Fe-2S family protein
MTTDNNSVLEQTLPSSWYTDSPVFELEREHIFFREWVCVGREEELIDSGDHKVLDLYGQSILLVSNEQC